MPSIAVSAVIWLPSWVAIDFGIIARPGVKFGSWVRKQRIEGVVDAQEVVDGVVVQDVVGDGDIMSFGIIVVVGLSILMFLALAFVVVLKVIVMVMLDGMVVGTATTLSPVGYVAIAAATFMPMDVVVLVLEPVLEDVIMFVVGEELAVLPFTGGDGIAAAAVGGDELPAHVFQFVFPIPIEEVIAELVADEELVHIFQVLEAAGVVELEGPIDVSESRETPGGPDH